MDIFVLLVPPAILSYHTDTYSSHGFRKDVQSVIDKVFRDNFLV